MDRAIRALEGIHLLAAADRQRRLDRVISFGIDALPRLAALVRSRDLELANSAVRAARTILRPDCEITTEALGSIARATDEWLSNLAVDALVARGDESVPVLARMLDAPRPMHRDTALFALRGIGSRTALDAIVDHVLRHSRTYRRLIRPAQVCAILALAILAVWLWFNGALHASGLGWAANLAAAAVVCLWAAVAALTSAATFHNVSTAVWRLSDVRDPRTVAMLCESLLEPTTRDEASRGLAKALPHLSVSDAQYFSREAVEGLHAGLAIHNWPLVTAIIAALAKVGNEDSAAVVRVLALATRDRSVRAAAEQALPEIEKRSTEARQATSLLRPAVAPDGQHLLRPVEPGACEAVNLVRPAPAPDAVQHEAKR